MVTRKSQDHKDARVSKAPTPRLMVKIPFPLWESQSVLQKRTQRQSTNFRQKEKKKKGEFHQGSKLCSLNLEPESDSIVI